jgi:ATP-dependent RNA helicase HelY
MPNDTAELSPAERYRAAKDSRKLVALTDFQELLKFPLDDFQMQACRALATDNSVLVAAPTGAGKTIVGEFAIHLALSKDLKVIYLSLIHI